MFRPKPKLVVVIEETFVLLKPDAAHVHDEMLRRFRNNGCQVTQRTMPATRALIETIVQEIGSVAAAHGVEEQLRRDLDAGRVIVDEDAVVKAAAATRAVSEQHVRHLLQGTCVAAVLSAPHAVDLVSRICGDEDPTVAKVQDPESLRAKYGSTLVANAVFCSSTQGSAARLISAVFGYQTEVRTEAVQEAKGGAAADGVASSAAPLLPGVARPAAGIVAVRNSTDSGAAAAQPPVVLLGAVEMLPTVAVTDEHAAVDFRDLHGTQLAEARQQLLDERETIRRESELLRQREVDLLLREEALRRAAEATASPAKPVLARSALHAKHLADRLGQQKRDLQELRLTLRDMRRTREDIAHEDLGHSAAAEFFATCAPKFLGEMQGTSDATATVAGREAAINTMLEVTRRALTQIQHVELDRADGRIEELTEQIDRCEEGVQRLTDRINGQNRRPLHVDEGAMAALHRMTLADLEPVVAMPGRIQTLFNKFEGAEATGKMQKRDFMRFYEGCVAFQDTGLVDDVRVVREAVARKRFTGPETLNGHEFGELLMWLVRR